MRKSTFLLILIPIIGLLSVSCADKKQVSELEKRVAAFDTKLASIQKSVQDLEQQKRWDELLKGMENVAYLTPGSDGYTVVQTDLGRLTVKLVNVQPYANGSRVTLQFGNLLNARINGAKATIEWGSVDEKGLPKNDMAKSREVKFSESLKAGSWTNVQVVLEAVPATDLGFVRVKDVTHTGIGLLK